MSNHPATWDDLFVGSNVAVSYEFDGTDNWAQQVEIAPRKVGGAS